MHMLIRATLILLFVAACGGTTGSNTVPDSGLDSGHDAAEDAVGADSDAPDAEDAADTTQTDTPDDGGVDDALDVVPDTAATTVCEGLYRPPVDVPMTEAELGEASGIVASRLNAGVLWMHNDSGDGPRLFAVGTDGAALGRLTLEGATASDWEDIAAGPCPDGEGQCLWVGDIGDNLMARTDAALYAVREPVIDGPFGELSTTEFTRFPVGYGDEMINSEALMVAPDGTRFWVIEKVDGDTARIFEAAGPLSPEQVNTFTPVGSFEAPGVAIAGGRLVTGADLHPTGTRVLVRVYTGSFEYRLTPGQSPADLGVAERVTAAPGPLSEGQGEAVGYSEDGLHVWTISESPEPMQPLHFYECPD